MRINHDGLEMKTLVDDSVYEGGLYAIGVEENPPLTIEDRIPDADLRGVVQLKAPVRGGVVVNHALVGYGATTSLRVGTGAPVSGQVVLRRTPRTYRRALLDIQILAPVEGSFTLTDSAVAHGQLEVSVLRPIAGSIAVVTDGDWKFANARLGINGFSPTQITCQGMACVVRPRGDEVIEIHLSPELDPELAAQIRLDRWSDTVNTAMMGWAASDAASLR